MNQEEYKKWVLQEYNIFNSELKDLSIDSFRYNKIIISMIGEWDGNMYQEYLSKCDIPWDEIKKLDDIGNPYNFVISGIFLRYLYYADVILQLNPKSILEIGGGFGGLCSVILTLAKHRGIKIEKYGIYDLKHVQEFQLKFLEESGIGTENIEFLDSDDLLAYDGSYNFVVSCFAIGEFSYEVKLDYINNVIDKVPNGLIVWNCNSLLLGDLEDNPETLGMDILLKIKPNIKIINCGTLHQTSEIYFEK